MNNFEGNCKSTGINLHNILLLKIWHFCEPKYSIIVNFMGKKAEPAFWKFLGQLGKGKHIVKGLNYFDWKKKKKKNITKKIRIASEVEGSLNLSCTF